jgi:DNA mismatch repair protein MSH2
MGGKSTYIRTIGLAAYLAHIGCYVPAAQFETSIMDSIITRVGASDMQMKGISTFMS